MIRASAVVFVALAINNLLGASLGIGLYYYLVPGVLLSVLLLVPGGRRIHAPVGAVYVACVASLAVNEVPDFFRTQDRLLAFVILTALLSPFVSSSALARFRVLAFWYLQWAMLALSATSFALFLVGFPGYDAGFYSGLTSHSMLMSPIAASSVLFCGFVAVNVRGSSRTTLRIALLSLAAMSLVVTLLSSSRAALISLLGAVLFIGIYARQSISRFALVGLGVAALASPLALLWAGELSEGLSRKASTSSFAEVESRAHLWDQRLAEFRSSPYFGIGYSAVDTNSTSGSFFSEGGQVEPGSSWLAIASMLGAFGIAAFAWVIVDVILSLMRIARPERGPVPGFLGALLVFWGLHMAAEGYLLAAGSFLFICVWLLLGTIHAIKDYPWLSLPPHRTPAPHPPGVRVSPASHPFPL